MMDVSPYFVMYGNSAVLLSGLEVRGCGGAYFPFLGYEEFLSDM